MLDFLSHACPFLFQDAGHLPVIEYFYAGVLLLLLKTGVIRETSRSKLGFKSIQSKKTKKTKLHHLTSGLPSKPLPQKKKKNINVHYLTDYTDSSVAPAGHLGDVCEQRVCYVP